MRSRWAAPLGQTSSSWPTSCCTANIRTRVLSAEGARYPTQHSALRPVVRWFRKDRVMKGLNQRLKEVFGPRTSEHDWCDTTRLADPWSVLLGRRPHKAEPADEPAVQPPERDLRETRQGTGKDGQR